MLERHFNRISLCKAELPPWASPIHPDRGLPTCLCLAGSQGWEWALRLLLHRVAEPGLLVHSPSQTVSHSYGTRQPQYHIASKDKICFIFSPVQLISFSFFLLEGTCCTSSQMVPLALCYLITVLITYLPGEGRESSFCITSNIYFSLNIKSLSIIPFLFLLFFKSSDIYSRTGVYLEVAGTNLIVNQPMTLAGLTFSRLFLEYDSDTALRSLQNPCRLILEPHSKEASRKREREAERTKAFVHPPSGPSLEKQVNTGNKVLWQPS